MKILITGGAGFIGTNLAKYYIQKKHTVTILDNFSRKGSRINAKALSHQFPKLRVVETDVRSYKDVLSFVKNNEIIFHLAGQVAVTNSIQNPREDFESNAIGTFHILEAGRTAGHKPIILDSSTNKVYGEIPGKIVLEKKRYVNTVYKQGISEAQPLDFHSPYGCSKGAADQYVRDYARSFELPTIVFRQSCIYGPHQFGIEDQGWVAHFAIQSLLGKSITIYGTGYQVRDILFIDDLIQAYDKAIIRVNNTKGEIFNIGGGTAYSISLLELLDLLEKLLKKKIPVTFKKKRPGDQDVYISNIKKAKRVLQWEPKTEIEKGLLQLITWVKDNVKTVKEVA